MKPEKIVMQGFGPYLDRTEVDFTKLSDNTLFLITGATGGGKTTILDAICFALYARATGGLRSWGQMRSIGAPDDLPTLVDYTFSLSGTRYRFQRSQTAYAARKTGERKIREEHACYRMENGQWSVVYAGAESKVAQCAQDILGLDCDQFSKVIMLPQGEFRRLLLSSSAEKAKIFEKLFSTGRWSKAADVITAQAAALNRRLEDLFLSRRSILEREQAKDIPELAEREAMLKKAFQNAQELAKEQETAVKKAEETLLAARKYKEYTDQTAACTKALLQAQKKKEEKERALLAAQEGEQQAQALRELHTRLIKEIPGLETALKSANEIDALSRQLSVLKKESEQITLTAQQAAQSEQAAQENVKKGESYVEQLQQECTRIPILYAKYQTLEEIAQSYQKLQAVNERRSLLIKETETARLSWEQDSLQSNTLKEKLEQINQKIKGNMAYELSRRLEDGTPCPVCGAVHHPAPAFKQDEILPAVQKEAARLEPLIITAEKETEKSKLFFLQKQAQLSQAEEELSAQQKVCDGYNIYYKTFQRDHQKAKQELLSAQALQEKLPRAQNLLQQRRFEYDTAHKTLEACKNSMEENRRKAESCLSSIETRKAYLPPDGGTAAELSARLSRAKQKAAEAEQKAAALQETLTAARQDSTVAGANAKNAEEQLMRIQKEAELYFKGHAEIIPGQIGFYSRARDEAVSQQKKALEETGRISQSLSSVTESLKILKKSEAEAKETEQRLNAAQRLSKFLSGANPGKTPIKMFVLGMMLDDIIIQANIYLSDFSNGRYSLSRITENTGGNALKGLDIEVFDAYGGGMRSVYTLSGGELFLASLSLAFGLSDVVQGYSGGIRLDSIFIDEGFGTLDRETLDTALKALDSIRGMGRLVGVISHVTELKTRIGAKIEVLPSKKGSTIKISTPD